MKKFKILRDLPFGKKGQTFKYDEEKSEVIDIKHNQPITVFGNPSGYPEWFEEIK